MITDTLAITEFLLARIGEDEAEARQTPEGQWCQECNGWSSGLVGAFDPARVLAECAAKRTIMGFHSEDLNENMTFDPVTREPTSWLCTGDDDVYPCTTMRRLAAVYSDHADYREEWRP